MRKYPLFLLIIICCSIQTTFSQTKKITGIIKDNNGRAVSSATIMEKTSNAGTISDSAGMFSLELKPGAILYISRVGFADTLVNVGMENSVTIVLRTTANALTDVSVQTKVYQDPQKTGAINGTINNERISNGLQDYNKAEINSSGPIPLASNTSREGISNWTFSNGPVSNTIYFGGGIPVFSAVKETRGSKYLLEDWGKGSVVMMNGDHLNTSALLFNYDKISKALLITADKKILIEVNKDSMQAFSITNADGEEYKYQRVAAINPNNFYQPLVANAEKYSAFKLPQTKFVKSDYHSNGLVETGTPYDEYVDTYEYYIVMPGGKTFQKLADLKSKSIKAALATDAAKVDTYFSQHKREDVNEVFLTGLVSFLNE